MRVMGRNGSWLGSVELPREYRSILSFNPTDYNRRINRFYLLIPSSSTPAAVGGDPLIWNPHPLRQFSSLPEHIDWNAAARVPVTTDPQPLRLDRSRNSFADRDRAVFVERTVIAEARDIEFQRFRLQQPLAGDVIDHEMGEVGLTGNRA